MATISFIVKQYPDLGHFWGATKPDSDTLVFLSARKREIIDELEKILKFNEDGGEIRVNNLDGSMQFKAFVPAKLPVHSE